MTKQIQINIDEIRKRAADSFRDGLAMNKGLEEPEFIVDNALEFIYSNNIVSGEMLSTRDEEALYKSLSFDEREEIRRTVEEEMKAQGWETV